MDQLLNALKIAFASEFSFYLKAQNFHWNVTGPDFEQFHALFGNIYGEVYGSIDAFAENIRKTGGFAPAGLQKLSVLSQVEDSEEAIPVQTMVQVLLADSDKIAQLMGMVYKIADGAGEYGLSNFLAERQDAHRKHSWMLRATLS